MLALIVTNPSQTFLSVDEAKLAYGKTQALSGVSLQLFAGEILGLLGPNGAGKTSLLQCIAGRLKVDSGRIKWHVLGDHSDLIGVVPQDIALYQDLTVVQNIDAFARFHGLPRHATSQVREESLVWAGLEEKRRSLVRTLSGGMQRRLNIACSVLHQPKVLLLDEPTVGVDPQSRERIYDMLNALLGAGTAILLTTHHLEEAQDRCDRIAIIDQGKIIDTGTFDELLSRTIGTAQHVRVQFSTPQIRVPRPLRLTNDRLAASCEMQDVSQQLPPLLAEIQAARLPMEDLSLRSPTLQHMFLHLTGKELRE